MAPVPVYGYRSKKSVGPVCYANVDADDVAKLEYFAMRSLRLEFGLTGIVLLKRKYFQLHDYRRYHKRLPLAMYLFGRFGTNQYAPYPSVFHLDSDKLNFSRTNILLYYGVSDRRQSRQPL